MDQESALLASINAKLEETIEKMRWKNKKSKIKTSSQARKSGGDETSTRAGDALWHGMRLHRVPLQCLSQSPLATGFHLSFLWICHKLLILLSGVAVQAGLLHMEGLHWHGGCASMPSWSSHCQLSPFWNQVVERHPDTVRERLWRTGVVEHSMLYCGGEVETWHHMLSRSHTDVYNINMMSWNVIQGGNSSFWRREGVCCHETWGGSSEPEDLVRSYNEDYFSGSGVWQLHLSAGDCVGGAEGACVAGLWYIFVFCQFVSKYLFLCGGDSLKTVFQ